MLTFKTATPQDAEAIVQLVNSCYRGESSKVGWTTEADILGGQRTDSGKVLEMIQGPDSRVELGFHGSQLVACIYIKKEDSQTGYLGMLAVSPAHQSSGLGKKMLAHTETLLRSWGCSRIRGNVIHVREELIQTYERMGFERTGKTEPFPYGDERFGLPKVPGLYFVELIKKLKTE